jgi:20S proteasome alpha/beta subunit
MACLSFLQAGEMCESLSYRFSLCCIKINRDQNLGFQLYQSDPSGNYAGWQATSIGANSQTAHSILKSDYTSNLSSDDAKKLALKVLKKIMDVTTVSCESVELIELTLAGDRISSRRISESEITELNEM